MTAKMPNPFAHLSFRAKLAMMSLSALLVLLGLLVWKTWDLLETELRGQLRTQVERTDTLLAASLALPLAQRDYATLAGIAERLVAQGTATHLVIFDHQGRMIVRVGWPAGGALPEAGEERHGVRHFQTPIDFVAQRLGEVHYGISLEFLEKARRHTTAQLLQIGLVGILLGLALLLPLDFWVTRRLGALEQAAQRLAAGQLDARIRLPGSDELSRLADAFNRMADSLVHRAHFDPLTQLPNRALLADRLVMALAQARRDGRRGAVALLDLDGFKPVNDTWGHAVGDRVLIEVANRLRATLRETDTIARLGGDEFVLVLSGAAEEHDYLQLLGRVLAALAQPYPIDGEQVSLSASIGVTFFPDDDADADALIRHADQAMYLAKQSGRNRTHVFDTRVDRDTQVRQEAIARFARALEGGELCLYYQPKADLRAMRIVGVEALVRWRDPERGLIGPADFLPLISEERELGIRLSEWVIETALSQLEAWQAQGLAIGISINLPAVHLQQPSFADFLAAALARHPHAPPALFELEVLESAALEDVVGVSARMERCRALGVRFALDDFGTGYASLAYLRRLPIDLLKIDQSFVRDMLHDPDDLAIVEGVLGLAQAFRDEVIAEGVETIDHARMLLHLGCDRAQGYGIGRPMPAEALPGWIAAWQPDAALREVSRYTLPRTDLPIVTAAVEHRRWVERLLACVERREAYRADQIPLDPRACRFGIWLHGEGRRRYARLAEFAAIDALHEEIHALGRRIAMLCESDEHAAAAALLPDLLAKRDALLDKLEGIIRAIAMPIAGAIDHSPR
ncbi:EAL domain-containing protein [Sulfuricystis multivorans]|uniref:EAL domain-containing protein n=1 Tax=Sulfuricystis multivorans TaxID=2211108 RepID=UPI000F84BD70|nr:EAL domain-containing protein [Sulfuricystis multivorans]